MSTLTRFSIVIVAFIHIAISIVEIFLWETPVIYGRLGFTSDVAHQVAAIVQNAGLYNGLIAAGLLWSAFAKEQALPLRTFFLICVTIAGIFGAVTLSFNTLILQTLPAMLAFILVRSTEGRLQLKSEQLDISSLWNRF